MTETDFSVGKETDVKLTIRCAMQAFPDWKIECSSVWTVLQLKSFIAKNCTTKPEISHQRLIYAGYLMENDTTLQYVFDQRARSANYQKPERHIIHLVHMNSESTMKSEGLRLRSNNVQRDPTNNSNSSSSQNQQISPEDGNLHTQNQNSANINGFAYYQENHPTYLPYAMAYYQYIQNIMQMQYAHHYQMSSFNSPNPAFLYANAVSGIPMSPYPLQMPNFALPNNFNPNAVAPQQVAVAPAMDRNIQGNDLDRMRQPPDLLDLAYKTVRFALLLMIIYLYSSWERFLIVLLAIIAIWFVQARRGRQPQGLDQAQANARQNPRPNNSVRETREADDVRTNLDNSQLVPPQTHARLWNIFWSTITTFFTSLVPEHQEIPIN